MPRKRGAAASTAATADTTTSAPVAARRGIVNSGGLFSPYYLFDVMARLHRQELDRDHVNDLAATVRSLFRHAWRQLESRSSSAETWRVWAEPLLDSMGYEPQRLDEAVATSAGQVPVGWVHVVANGEPLVLIDVHGPGTDLESSHYPQGDGATTQPIALAFEAAVDAHATARWGLLSNGTELRLYRKGGHVARQYLAAAFAALIDTDLPDEWTALYACFRADSLTPGGDGRSFVDRILAESSQHATRIADDLRENVREAVEALARGVLASRSNWAAWGGGPPDRDVAKRLFDESLRFLYRLLFIAFAEAHDLLPATSSSVYRQGYAFEHLRDLCDLPLPSGAGDNTYIWQSLQLLSRMVRDGYGSDRSLLIIPPLGGELFREESTPILSNSIVTDQYMHRVIQALSLDRSGRRGAPSRFSYLDLGVDQLGSVYEGLLAYEADISTEPMVEARLTRNGKPTGEVLLVPELAVERSHRLMPASDEVISAGTFIVRAQGARRKASGSYYTPAQLARVMVEKALEPLVAPIIAGCGVRGTDGTPARLPDEILDITVIDQAMGSGAFLVHAAHVLGEAYRRAVQAIGEAEGRLDALEMSAIKRLIAQRCIYGIDLNPLAVELAKVSLWLETLALDEPLSFLDSHLRCGNSLIGSPMALEGDGPRLDRIPDDAYGTVRTDASKDWKDRMRAVRRRNAVILRRLEEHSKQEEIDIFGEGLRHALGTELDTLRGLHKRVSEAAAPDASLDAKRQLEVDKATAFGAELSRTSYRAVRDIADLWCAVWFWPEGAAADPPTSDEYRAIGEKLFHAARDGVARGLTPLEEAQLSIARTVAAQRRFLHRWLEFPAIESSGGYGVVVGNPPWETVNSNRGEFFAAVDAETIALEGQALDARIVTVLAERPEIAAAWAREVLLREQEATFFASSGTYQWRSAAGGYVNTYQLFFERGVRELARGGECALVLAGAFVLKPNATEVRRAAVIRNRLRFLVLSDNERKTYPGIDHRVEFCLVQVARDDPVNDLPCLFLVGKREDGDWRSLPLSELVDAVRALPEGAVTLPLSMIETISPETWAPPMITSPRDGTMLRHIFRRFRRLGDPDSGWTAEFGAEIHSSGDREHFRHRDDLVRQGGVRVGELRIDIDGERFVPLLEGRNVWQLVYSFTDPKLWISEASVTALLRPQERYKGMRSNETIRVGWRDIARIIDRRTMVPAILPAGTSSKDKLPYVRAGSLTPARMVLLAAIWSSFAFDWQMRTQGIGSMKFGPLMRQPVPAPSDVDDLLSLALAALQPEWLRGQAEDACGVTAAEDEWWLARAKLDARIFRCYEWTLEDAAYILSTFPQLDREQLHLTGEERSSITRDLVLAETACVLGYQDADIAQLFTSVGRTVLGGIGSARERADHALALGARPYIETPQADQARQWAEDEGEDQPAELRVPDEALL